MTDIDEYLIRPKGKLEIEEVDFLPILIAFLEDKFGPERGIQRRAAKHYGFKFQFMSVLMKGECSVNPIILRDMDFKKIKNVYFTYEKLK